MRAGDTLRHKTYDVHFQCAAVDDARGRIYATGFPVRCYDVSECEPAASESGEVVGACSDEAHRRALEAWAHAIVIGPDGEIDVRCVLCARALERQAAA